MEEIFRIYIFDESHKYVVEEWPEWEDFLKNNVEYVKVSDMDAVKEDLLERRFDGLSEYGIMLARNKCEVHDFDCGFETHYIEDDEYSVGTMVLFTISHRDIFDGTEELVEEIYPSENDGILRIFSYNKKRLNIESAKFRYIDVTSEGDIKRELIYGRYTTRTYMVLDEDIKIKKKDEGYKNYRVITEKHIEERMEDILSESYDIVDKTIMVFTINAKFDSHKNFKSVPVASVEDMKETFKKISREADLRTFEERYCYVIMPSDEIRLYDTFGSRNNWADQVKYNWINANGVRTLGYAEMKNLMSKIKEEGRNDISV